MAIGKGLESLIPKKQNTFQSQAPSNGSVRLVSQNQPPQGASRPFHSQTIPHAHPIPAKTQFSPILDPGHIEPFLKTSEAKNSIRSQSQKQEAVFQIEIEKIKPNPFQPRTEFNSEALQELAQSIREFGIIQPLVVTKIIKETESGTAVEYQLIAGERRLMAAKMVGLERVPAIVRYIGDSRSKLELALIENIQRSNLNPLESARAYSRLQDEFGFTQREIATRVGKSREAIANALRLLHLLPEVQEALSKGKINESQARTLLSLENPSEQMEALNRLLSGQVRSVRSLRAEVEKAHPEPERIIDSETRFWEKRIEEILGASVKVISQGKQGKIVIQYYSEEERRSLFQKLAGPEEM